MPDCAGHVASGLQQLGILGMSATGAFYRAAKLLKHVERRGKLGINTAVILVRGGDSSKP